MFFNVRSEQKRLVAKTNPHYQPIIVAGRRIYVRAWRWPQNLGRDTAKAQEVARANLLNRNARRFHRGGKPSVFRIVGRRARHHRAADFEVVRHVVQSVNVIRVGVRRQQVINSIETPRPEKL